MRSLIVAMLLLISNTFGMYHNENGLYFPVIENASTNKAIVYVELTENSDAIEYCFQYPGTKPQEDSFDWLPITNLNNNVFHCFKYDGEYDIYVRNTKHIISAPFRIKVDSGYTYTFDANNVKPLSYALSCFLEEHNTSLDVMNQYITNEIMEAGWQTREGVAVSALSCISYLAEYGVGIPYQGFGAYQYEKQWGANPEWGAWLPEPVNNGTGPDYHVGMQCVGGCVWAFKQAGINLYNVNVSWQIGRCGETNAAYAEGKSDNIIDYRKARTGDLVQINSHYRTIMDRIDSDGDGVCESYLSFEMHKGSDTGCLTCRIVPMNTLQRHGRYVFNMDNVYNGNGWAQKFMLYWQSSLIPYDVLPEYIKENIKNPY